MHTDGAWKRGWIFVLSRIILEGGTGVCKAEGERRGWVGHGIDHGWGTHGPVGQIRPTTSSCTAQRGPANYSCILLRGGANITATHHWKRRNSSRYQKRGGLARELICLPCCAINIIVQLANTWTFYVLARVTDFPRHQLPARKIQGS